jgi:hypothetical protein
MCHATRLAIPVSDPDGENLMSEAHNDAKDDRQILAAALGAEGGKHRGSASPVEEPEIPAHGKHRRVEDREA